jgi:phosphonoacetaldehyde hydrolase
VGEIREIEGTSQVFSELHHNDVLVSAGSGFPSDISKAIIEKLGWEKNGFLDYWTCSETVGKSRPDPIMIHSIMKHLKVKDPLSVIKVDDTAIGIEEGVRAGVITIGVLTGTQNREKLQKANPNSILESVRNLIPYLTLNGLL